jgi:glycosyltransferase involved in cell wall biosynthesis
MTDAARDARAARSALVVCYSRLVSDPRVTRQIAWLVQAGWTVDTVGFGPVPDPRVRRHYPLAPHRGIARTPLGRLALHVLLPNAARFRALDGALIPTGLEAEGRAGYDLVVVNDLDLLPWAERAVPDLLRPGGRAHLDVHEYHRWEGHGVAAIPRRVLFAGFHRWLVRFVGSPVFTSRTTVAPGIAELYARDFGVALPTIVRNSPDEVVQDPSDVDPRRIELLYHGNPDLSRGLPVLIEAMRLLSDRFHLTLMLTGDEGAVRPLREMAADLGSRVDIVPAVPMAEVARAINRYDLEVIFYPPNSPNHLFSFPNKFFEAIQGRLGVVVGESPSMADVVRHYGNGTIVDGWTAADLARTLEEATSDDIRAFKRAADRASHEINSASEGRAFLAAAWPEV